MSDKYFENALSNFMNDFAVGGSIRHLADNGFTVKEIHARLDFPIPVSKVSEAVWKHFIETGIIRLSEPDEEAFTEKVSFVKEQDSFGRTSFRRVTEKIKNPETTYFPCDFGKMLYKDKTGFEKKLEVLSTRDKDYILGLPWPLQTVWHIADERMTRILSKLLSR
ncbi:MAG: hypothetical protein IJ796_00545 [Lachnospiraceae bacterium]|nr:hypothetical protein [Lachnospiraceae bacterium]